MSVVRDDEHNSFALAIEDRAQGYPRRSQVGETFVASGEYPHITVGLR